VAVLAFMVVRQEMTVGVEAEAEALVMRVPLVAQILAAMGGIQRYKVPLKVSL
jgi:hypothetical protein|tara:strand:- start:132 stop:290 length:159 start_codon:yes stop_codon:yes gene_type:complete